MKFHVLVGAVAGVAICATAATAQVCQGDLSFRRNSTHVGGAVAVSNNSTSFGGGVTVGHPRGWYAGGSAGMTSFDNVDGHSLAIGGGLGYSMPLQQRSNWQICPGGTVTAAFGPSIAVGNATMKLSSQTVSLGTSIGTSVALTKSINLLPFGSAAFGYTRATAKLSGNNGSSTTTTDSYLLLGMGAGFQLTPSLVLRPNLNLAAGADIIDDTIYGLSVTWALPR